MSEPAIRARDLRFAWRGGFTLAIDRLDIARGETVLLLGPSGGGKSTLLSLIAGVIAPQAGKLEVLGRDMAAMRPSARDRFRAEHVGVVFQSFNLVPYLGALDNALLGLAFAPARKKRVADPAREARALLDALGLEPDLAHRRAARASVGQQQRIAVARALIGGPDILLADEPTSALDRSSQERFLALTFAQIERLGATFAMASHDDRLAARFDRVLGMEDVARTRAEAG